MVGHGHWDHAGQIEDFPNAVLYIQREELKAIEWALNYPNKHIRAINSDPGGCFRTPACGYMPLTMENVYGKILAGKAVIVDGEMEIEPGIKIHPAFRAHTGGSQLLEVPTSIGKLVFGSDAYSSWEGIRDWMPANIQQTDTVQQFLAYEKCYNITGGYDNCVVRPRALVLHRQVSADQEFLGRHQRLAHGRDRAGSGREVAQAQHLSLLRCGGEPQGSPPLYRRSSPITACPVSWSA